MNEPTPGRIEVEAILTTDQPVEAYGGIRLSVEALHQLADQVMQPGAEMVLNHDRTRPLNASNVHAEVRWNERGWHEVVMVFEADAAAWAEFEAEKKALGAPGGMSFSTCAPLATGGTGDRPVVRIAADAHHFSPADLEEAGMQLLPVVDVELQELFQFSSEPPAKVLIEYGIEVARAVPPDMLAAFLYDSLKGLIRKRRDGGGKTTVDFSVTETPGVRITSATITTDSETVALRAIEALRELGSGRYKWEGDDGPYAPV
ncbi:MAG: hypothetical protein QOE09_2633 [Ilumatobacteraceae bacterium]|jgi:hypothetical protein